MKFSVLGSGSNGNSVLIGTPDHYLLIDLGLSAKQTTLRLASLGVHPSQLSAILLTHEHGDHTRGLDVFLRKHPLPVFASTRTARVVQEKLRQPADWQVFESGQSFTHRDLEIGTFRLPHDAVEPVGYTLRHRQRSLAVATDLGHAEEHIIRALEGIEALVLEANYHWPLLEADPRRPFSLKQRIASRHGHLSNEQAAELIARLTPAGLRHVVLGHLSSDCNTPAHALRCVRELNPCEHTLSLACASQDSPTPWHDLELSNFALSND